MRRWGWLPACALLAGCSDPLAGPIDLFHDLEGGQIAAHRPPPPGLGQPYPKLGTVPPKPVVADAGYRQALQSQLATERDRTERVAADRPIEAVPPTPPPAPPPAPAPHGPAAPPGADAQAADAGQSQAPATATLDTAESVAGPQSPVVSGGIAPTHAAESQPSATGPGAESGPPPGTPLTIAGAPPEFGALPDMPDTPPPPATFEGVAAEPAPTAARLPARLPPPPAGTPIFFPVASAALPDSQTQPLRDFLSHRHGQTIEVLGLGDAASDTPEGQATAIALGLARARAVAAELAVLHVPASSLRLGADAFGRGAVLRLLP